MAILNRSRTLPMKFRRIRGQRLAELLRGEPEPADPGIEVPAQLAPAPVPETTLPGTAADQPGT